MGSLPRRLIPAYAGSTRRALPAWVACGAHPRLRGEHLALPCLLVGLIGSSPLTRGARVAYQASNASPGLIPAYAGSTLVGDFYALRLGAHPRLRGEHILASTMAADTRGSSPLTRGARLRPATVKLLLRLIPAYAGSTLAEQE